MICWTVAFESTRSPKQTSTLQMLKKLPGPWSRFQGNIPMGLHASGPWTQQNIDLGSNTAKSQPTWAGGNSIIIGNKEKTTSMYQYSGSLKWCTRSPGDGSSSHHLLTVLVISGGNVTSAINSVFCWSCQTKNMKIFDNNRDNAVFFQHFLQVQLGSDWGKGAPFRPCDVECNTWWDFRVDSPISNYCELVGCKQILCHCSMLWDNWINLHECMAFILISWMYLYTKVEIWFERPRNRQ